MPFITVDMSSFSGLAANYKTYVVAAVGVIGNALTVFHVVTLTPDQLLSANAVIGMFVAIFLRMGVKKAQVAAANAGAAAVNAITTVRVNSSTHTPSIPASTGVTAP
jgi:hypothetical protein